MMQVFDAPEALSSIGDRPSTTIAPQALLLLNNPNVRELRPAFARRLVAACGANRRKPRFAKGYRIALGREPEAEELKDSAAFIAGQLSLARSGPQAERPGAGPVGLLPGAVVSE